jgi:hypothetical protein
LFYFHPVWPNQYEKRRTPPVEEGLNLNVSSELEGEAGTLLIIPGLNKSGTLKAGFKSKAMELLDSERGCKPRNLARVSEESIVLA